MKCLTLYELYNHKSKHYLGDIMDYKLRWLLGLGCLLLQYLNLTYFSNILAGHGIISLLLIFYPIILIILILIKTNSTHSKDFGYFIITYTIFGRFPKKNTHRELYLPELDKTITLNYYNVTRNLKNTVNVNRGNYPIYETYNVGEAILEVLFVELDESTTNKEKRIIKKNIKETFLEIPYLKGYYRKRDYIKSISNFYKGQIKESKNRIVVFKTNHKDLKLEIVFK